MPVREFRIAEFVDRGGMKKIKPQSTKNYTIFNFAELIENVPAPSKPDDIEMDQAAMERRELRVNSFMFRLRKVLGKKTLAVMLAWAERTVTASEIADVMEVHRSTVSRYIERVCTYVINELVIA